MIKRDNAYYLNRLKKEHPEIFKKYQNGEFKNPAAALSEAGLKKRGTKLQAAKRAWKNLSEEEKKEFLADCSLENAGTGSTSVPKPAEPIATKDRRLLPNAKATILQIMDKRGLKVGGVMDELGFSRLDASLGSALRLDYRISSEMIDKLQDWISDNARILA